jgi:hypothetical protein
VKAFPHFPLQPIDVRYRHLTSGIGSRTTGTSMSRKKMKLELTTSASEIPNHHKKKSNAGMLEWLKIETFFLSARVVGGASSCSRGVYTGTPMRIH